MKAISKKYSRRHSVNKSKRGQSMVEYALAIGCVAALCMIALGSLGHLSGHMIYKVNNAINAPGNEVPEPVEMVKLNAKPWVLQ